MFLIQGDSEKTNGFVVIFQEGLKHSGFVMNAVMEGRECCNSIKKSFVIHSKFQEGCFKKITVVGFKEVMVTGKHLPVIVKVKRNIVGKMRPFRRVDETCVRSRPSKGCGWGGRL